MKAGKKSQKQLFIEKAKELGETTEAAFNAALKRISSAKVVEAKGKTKKRKKGP